MNAPERSSTFLLDEDSGERKIVYTPDTKVTNAGTFRLNKEDHTIANLLRMQLLRDPAVRFAGYIHPHPLVHYIDLKIQTNTTTNEPSEVLSNAIEDLNGEVSHDLIEHKSCFVISRGRVLISIMLLQTDHLVNQVQEAIEKWRKENEEVMVE